MSATPLLKVDDLSVHFKQGQRDTCAVERVSFSIQAGETLALVGESGSGKSVTAHSILKLLPYPMAYHPSGSIEYAGRELINLDDSAMQRVRGSEIGMIFQEPLSALNPLHTIGKQISEAILLQQKLTPQQAKEKAIEWLDRVQIPDPRQKFKAYPHQLSGGQRQRVMIAMALVNQPKLLIADEPTTALDVTVQKQIMDLLHTLQQQMGMGILLITHDLGVVQHYADRVAVMQNGKLVEQQAKDSLFDQPQHPYTQQLLNSEPTGSAVPVDNEDSAPLLSAQQLKVWFSQPKPLWQRQRHYVKAVDGIDLHIQPGTTVGIVGESGSGKSTLAQALLRLIDSEGQILFNQQSIEQFDNKAMRPLRRQLQMVFQDPFSSLSPRMTIADIIAEGLRIHEPESMQQHEQKVIDVMQEVGLDPDSRHRYPHEFSGGQRQRVAIARAIILEPKLIVLDEPTSALDRSVQGQVLDLLKTLQRRRHLTYLFISHDLKVIRSISHQVIVMKDGQVVEAGAAQQLLKAPKQVYTQRLLNAALG